MKLELVLLSWGLRKMEEELGEAPSSKEEDEVECCSSPASISGILRRCSGEVEGLQWWERGGSSSMALVRERN